MKKLKDLKENEAIFIANKKEAKAILNLTKINGSFRLNTENYVVENIGRFWWTNTISVDQIVLPASDFIKPKAKTSKRLKQLEKKVDYLSDFVANMVFKKVGLKFSDSQTTYEPGGVHFPFNEMPRLSREEVAKRPDCFVKVNESGTGLVFEPDGNPEPKELEVGKWYKDARCKDGRGLYFVEQVLDKDTNPVVSYGFNRIGYWSGSMERSDSILSFPKASKEEVESALIAEAERRGFKEGVQVKRLAVEDTFNCSGNFYWSDNDGAGGLFDRQGVAIIQKGKWAEIIEQPKELTLSQRLIKEAKELGFKQGCYIDNSPLGFNFKAIYNNDSSELYFDGAYLNIGKKRMAIWRDGVWAKVGTLTINNP